jgi:FkbM family methyltransferase
LVRKEGFEFFIQPGPNIDFFLEGPSKSIAVEKIIRRHVRPGAVALDIGANLGWTTRLLSHLAGPTGEVHAFEPIDSAYRNLLLNIDACPVKNIIPHHVAVSDRCGVLDLFIGSSDETALASMRRPNADGKYIASTIDAITVDSLLDSLPAVSFVKIDVEGAEFNVLAGMQQLIARDHPVLAIELSEGWLRELGSSADQVLGFLHEREYEVFKLNDAGEYVRVTLSPREQIDVVCIPRRSAGMLCGCQKI